MKHACILLVMLMVLGGCRPLSLYGVAPDGPPEYRLGWEDGCDTGLSAEGSTFHKVIFGFKKRPELGGNDQYKQAWNEGFTYCRFTLARHDGDLM